MCIPTMGRAYDFIVKLMKYSELLLKNTYIKKGVIPMGILSVAGCL